MGADTAGAPRPRPKPRPRPDVANRSSGQPGRTGGSGSAGGSGGSGGSRGGTRAARPKRPRRSKRRLLRPIAYVTFLALLGLSVGGFALLDSIALPRDAALARTSFVCLADVADRGCTFDRSIAQFSATENRVVLTYDEIPTVVINAVVAAEDREFFHHNGIDPVGIARALFRDLTGSGSLQGGSTITQEYVKITYLTRERTLTRKLKEAALAIKLERKLTKQQILERYLNSVYFGRGAYGIEAAARAYFGVGAAELRLDQAAYLAGLLRAPEKADASRSPAEATRRRHTVLVAMTETGAITRAQATTADAVPWPGNVLDRPPRVDNVRVTNDFGSFGGGYITEWVRQQLIAKFGESTTYTKGLRVYLTIDPRQQRAAYTTISSTLNKPDDPAAALVAIDEKGRVTAMVGGTDFAKNKVNFALGQAGGGSGRQPGSTFKAFALAAFVEAGYSVQSVFPAPAQLVLPKADEGQDWTVQSYEDEDLGNATVEQGTWDSSNTLYAQLTQKVGAKAVADEARKIGITTPVKAVNSVMLGTSEVSVLDLAAAYSTFANHGVLNTPYVIRRVEAADGTVLFQQTQPQSTQAISADVADTVTSVLRGVIAKGTGKSAKLRGREAAGKTGTTQEHRDAWFAGYTCHLTAAIWMGYDTPQPMDNVHGVKVSGGTFPAQMWKKFMDQATTGNGKCTYRQIDAGKNKLNPDLPVGPTTTTTTTLPGAPATIAPGAPTTLAPGATTAAPATVAPATAAPTTAPAATTAPPH